MAELDIPGIDGLAGQARVLVKNTFLDLDDVPRMPELNRLRTAPAGGNVGIDGDEDEGDDLDDLDDAEDAAITGESPDSAAPEMPGIYRQVTCDGFEPMAQWHWTQSASAIDPRLSVEWEPELTPEAPPPTPTGGQAPMPMMHPAQNCVMIVPNSMVPGQGMMMAMMPAPLAVQGFGELDACPPGCMAVRADMYGRWPVQQYAAPQANTTGGLSAASAPAASASAAPPAAGKGSGGYGGSSATAASPPVAPAALQDPEERRIEPMLENKAVTYNEMVTEFAARGQHYDPGSLYQHWQGLKIAGKAVVEEKSEEPAKLRAPAPPAPTLLTRAHSVNTGIFRIHWTVDARKLKSNDRVHVSPQFEIDFYTSSVPFKMLIHPKVVSELKGGHSFRKAKGRGKVELKCEGVVDEAAGAMVTYRLLIASGKAGDKEKRTLPRGPVKHDFARGGVSGLKQEDQEWDFPSVVDEETQTFVVVLEIMPS